ncbi:MAG TPA: SwmB domain-containing protein [Pseudonocardiaceae bacterium]
MLGVALTIVSAGTASASGGPGSGGGGSSGGGSGSGGGGSGGGGSGGGGSGGGGSGGGGGGSGSGGGVARLRVTGSCGDMLDIRLKTVGGPITLTVTIPSVDPSEVWSLDMIQQDFSATTGGRIGNPVNLLPSPLPPLAFTPAEGGFSTTGDVINTSGLTHGYSYTATRTSPTPLSCTAFGYFTNPGGTSGGPTAENPSGKPDTAPALTGNTEADIGTNDALMQFDQEMLTGTQGTPLANRFTVTVNGTTRTATAVAVTDDSPPFEAVVDVTFSGAVLRSGQTVAITYHPPLSASDPALQDLDSLKTGTLGPISIPAF